MEVPILGDIRHQEVLRRKTQPAVVSTVARVSMKKGHSYPFVFQDGRAYTRELSCARAHDIGTDSHPICTPPTDDNTLLIADLYGGPMGHQAGDVWAGRTMDAHVDTQPPKTLQRFPDSEEGCSLRPKKGHTAILHVSRVRHWQAAGWLHQRAGSRAQRAEV